MMGAIIFDMDGTLVQSERLWAQSYAIAVQRLRSLPEPDQRVIERVEVSRFFIDQRQSMLMSLLPRLAEGDDICKFGSNQFFRMLGSALRHNNCHRNLESAA